MGSTSSKRERPDPASLKIDLSELTTTGEPPNSTRDGIEDIAGDNILVSVRVNKTITITEGKTVATQTGEAQDTSYIHASKRSDHHEPSENTVFIDHVGGYSDKDAMRSRGEEIKEKGVDDSGILDTIDRGEIVKKKSIDDLDNLSATDRGDGMRATVADGVYHLGASMAGDGRVGKQAWEARDAGTETEFKDDGDTVSKENASIDQQVKTDAGNVDIQSKVRQPFTLLALERYGKYKVRVESDTEKCIISAAAFLDSGDLVIIDRSNQKIKYVDKTFEFISYQDLPSKPWAVCARGLDVYVSMGNTEIQHLFVKDMLLEPERMFQIKGRCLGLCVFGEYLAVGLQVGEICLLDTVGQTKDKIKLPVLEDGKTCNPWHLQTSSEANLLVTDSDAGVVFCLNKKAEIVFTYTAVSSPRATTIDSQGNIVVVGRDLKSGVVVAILSREFELQNMLHIDTKMEPYSRVLMDWEELGFVPYCVSYRTDNVIVYGGIQEALKIMRLT